MDWTKVLAFDVETAGLNGPLHRLAYLTGDGMSGWLTPDQAEEIIPFFQRAEHVVAHNAKYDIKTLAKVGIEVPWEKLDDTLVMAALILPGSQPKSLLELSMKYLDYDGKTDAKVAYYVNEHNCEYDKIPDNILRPYTDQQLVNTIKLFALWYSEVPQEAYELEMRVIRALFDMEQRGVLVDLSYLSRADGIVTEEMEQLQIELDTLAQQTLKRPRQATLIGKPVTSFNPASNETRDVLLAKGFFLPKSEKGNYSVSREAIEPYSYDPFVATLLEWRKLQKIKSTYLVNLQEAADQNAVIHPNFSNTSTRTGRLSCSDPNLQNVAKNEIVKQAFIVRPGYRTVSIDFKQIEFLLAIFLSGDTSGMEAFNEGIDFHTSTAIHVFGDAKYRSQAKTLNFGLIYGMQAYTLSKRLGWSEDKAEKYIASYFAHYSGIASHRKKILANTRQTGTVKLSNGRVLRLESTKHYKGYNWKISAEAAIVVKRAMCNVADAIRNTDINLLLQIHDELVIEIPSVMPFEETYRELGKIMCNASQYPLSVDYDIWDGSWANLKQGVPF